MRVIHTSIDYHWLGKVENELRQSHYQLKEISYLENVDVQTYVLEAEVESYCEWMTNLTNGQAAFTHGAIEYLEEDVPNP